MVPPTCPSNAAHLPLRCVAKGADEAVAQHKLQGSYDGRPCPESDYLIEEVVRELFLHRGVDTEGRAAFNDTIQFTTVRNLSY